MSDGVRLASGYISLSVKTDGAMKDLVAEITGVGKQAEKAGKAAGDALSKGIAKGAKDAGKAVNDEFVSGATKAGESAGKAAGGALEKGVRQGAEKAGKSAGDALDKGIGDAAKQSGKKAGDSIGGSIVESVNKAAATAGIDLNKVLVDAAGKAGGAVGRAIGDSPVGQWLQGISDKAAPVVDGLHNIGDAITGIRDKDAAGTLNGVAGALNSIGQSGAGDAVKDLAGKVVPLQTTFGDLKTQIDGSGQLLRALGNDAPGIAGKLGQIGTAASAMAGPLAAAAAAALQIDQALHIDSNTFDPGQHGWGHVLFGKVPDWLGLTDPSNGLDKHLTPAAPSPAPAGRPAPPPVTAPATDYSWLPKRAKGGVTPAGQIYGPGTGMSDSIIGVGADGLPTARVSTGEGVVKKSAMDRGGAAVVAALNGGMKLPGYDDGTNNVGGPPIPMPAIQVPQATTGAAGQLNDFLNSVQGHPYQYGTLYDCSGFMSQLYNRITGKQMPRFNTESDLAAYGFVRGSKPGEFNLGIHHGGGGPNSHMAGTLPDGRAVESAGNGVQIGAGAHGANDPQFEDHWFLPGSGAMAGLGASITGVPDNPADLFAAGDPAGGAQRTQGYIPAGAGGGGQAGTSLWSGAMQMGASAVNQVIDQAASAASTAISAAATAGSFGAGGQAGAAAAQFAIGIGTAMAKRGVQYGFQMAGIGGDALAEILLPFGVPRFFQTDPSQFMPQLPGQAVGVTTGEKAEQQQDNPGGGAASPTGPVQPGQMPGQQPVGAPAPIATAGAGDFTPAPTPMQGLAGTQPQGPAAPTPQPSGSPAPVQGPWPVQGPKPPQAPPPVAEPLRPTDLGGLLGLARGGVIPGKFDNGGWLMPNGIAINQTNRPEPILNDEQWGNLHAIAAKGMPAPDPKAIRGGDDYSVHIERVTVTDVNEMQREIDSRQRLQRMRYGGRP